MAVDDPALDALFDEHPATARGLAASYQALLGGVPTAEGFVYLIGTAVASNYGSYRSDIVFNDENIFINLTNALVQGNAAARLRFEALTDGAATLADQVEALYRALVPSAAQSEAGLAFMLRADALRYYAETAASRGVAGDDGAAVVALASLLHILVREDIGGLGDDVNDFIAAVDDGTARLGENGFTDIDVADGTGHDGDETPADTIAPTVTIAAAAATVGVGATTEITFAFSEPVEGFSLADVTVVGGALFDLERSADDPTVYTATFVSGPVAGVASIALTGQYQDFAGNPGSGGSLAVTINAAPAGSPTATLADGVEDTPYIVSAADLLLGFSDPDGGTLAVSGLASSQGSVADNGDGTFTITLPANYNGPVTLTYAVTDGQGGSTPASQDFDVDPVDDGPELVSVSSDEIQGNGDSAYPSISADGRYLAFHSLASNFVADDTNGVEDIFVRDLVDGTTTLVSVGLAGVQANGISYEPAVSADGRYVTFRSYASNLVADDTNNAADIFVRDLVTDTTTLVSVGPAGFRATTAASTPRFPQTGAT